MKRVKGGVKSCDGDEIKAITLDEKVKVGEIQDCNRFTSCGLSTTTKACSTVMNNFSIGRMKNENIEKVERRERSIRT